MICVSNLDHDIRSIKDFDHLAEVLLYKITPKEVPHWILAFVPEKNMLTNFYQEFHFDCVSRHVRIALMQKMKAENNHERKNMLLKIEGFAKVSSFYGVLFEPIAIEALFVGGRKDLELRSLKDSTRRELVIEKDCSVKYVFDSLYAEHAERYLQIPSTGAHPSCDSWMVDDRLSLIVFFQITSSYEHSVGYSRLAEILDELSQSNKSSLQYEKMLVFVVPDTEMDAMSARYAKQRIEGLPTPKIPDSLKDSLWMEYFQSTKTGICPDSYKESVRVVSESDKIAENRITLEHVHARLTDFSSRLRHCLEDHFEENFGQAEPTIKQCVLGIPVLDQPELKSAIDVDVDVRMGGSD